jgi:hypothetical protein
VLKRVYSARLVALGKQPTLPYNGVWMGREDIYRYDTHTQLLRFEFRLMQKLGRKVGDGEVANRDPHVTGPSSKGRVLDEDTGASKRVFDEKGASPKEWQIKLEFSFFSGSRAMSSVVVGAFSVKACCCVGHDGLLVLLMKCIEYWGHTSNAD